jgi:hypothetical protein
MSEPVELETERLLLRPFRLTDAEDYFAFAQDPEWALAPDRTFAVDLFVVLLLGDNRLVCLYGVLRANLLSVDTGHGQVAVAEQALNVE